MFSIKISTLLLLYLPATVPLVSIGKFSPSPVILLIMNFSFNPNSLNIFAVFSALIIDNFKLCLFVPIESVCPTISIDPLSAKLLIKCTMYSIS